MVSYLFVRFTCFVLSERPVWEFTAIFRDLCVHTQADTSDMRYYHFLARTVQFGEEDCLLVSLGSLSALVYQHSITPISLPCALRIPEKGKQPFNRKLSSHSTPLC